MKKLTKFFFVAAALFAGFSCTTDAVEDLGVAVGGQTTLTISLEESRTQLGEKADGVYPLYWSVGDQISVNGVASAALTEGGGAAAAFTFDGILSYPYSVVYPAASASEVTFPAEQNYVAGSFASGAAPMYGYAAENETIQLRHLAGALRFDVLGNATLSNIVVEAANGSLSGTYAVDCTTGALTAKESTLSNSVSLNFGDGLALSATATPIYVAVPAGNYGIVTVKLYSTAQEVMTVTFDTTSKPVVAGMVREFNEISYKGEMVGEFGFEGDVVITTANQLVQLSAASAANALGAVTSVTIGANIDMTGINWTPIGTPETPFSLTFDGGNYEIKGLNAPLFYYTQSAIVKNVNLTDVDVKVTELFTYDGSARAYSGALAYYMYKGELINCSASGKLEVDMEFKNADTTQDATSNYAVNIAAMVGVLRDMTTVTKCTNKVDLTITSLFGPAEESKFYAWIGGLTSHIPGTDAITECVNYGDIKFVPNQATTRFRIGGVFSYGPAIATADKLENYGDIESHVSTTSTQYIGGTMCMPYTTTTISNCKNSGSITIGSDVTSGDTYVGSIIAGGNKNISISNCVATNNAEGKGITVACDCTKLYTGLVGKLPSGGTYTHSIVDCTNSTDLHCTSDMSSSGPCYPTLVFTDTESSAKVALTMTNVHASGNIVFEGEVKGYFYAAGLIGYWRSENAKTYKMTVTDCSYSGDITINGSLAQRPAIGGVMAYNSGNYASLTNVHHTGNITVHNTIEGNTTNWTAIGGFIGYDGQEPPLTNCTNTGDITVTGNFQAVDVAHPLRVGGIVGYPNSFAKIKAGVINTGDIKVGAAGVETKVNFLCVGGIWGEVTSASATMTDPINTGNITITNVANASVADSYVGGIVGKTIAKVTNAQCYCNIAAAGYTNLGWATGSARVKDSIVATNCKFGGNLVEIEIDDEDESQKEKSTPLTADNYFDYIFGGTTDWTGVENYDGCTLLTASPLAE